MSDGWTPDVSQYRTWQDEPRVVVVTPDGKRHTFTLEEAAALQESLRETIRDIEDGEDNG
jgi:hypothetical protein